MSSVRYELGPIYQKKTYVIVIAVKTSSLTSFITVKFQSFAIQTTYIVTSSCDNIKAINS
jgi:hypothetical protein